MSSRRSSRLLARLSAFAVIAALFSTISVHAGPEGEAIESVFARLVLREFEPGEQIVRRVTSQAGEEITDSMLHSFTDRMRWSQSRGLRARLNSEFGTMSKEFEEFRKTQGATGPIEEGHVFTPAEREFLEKSAAEHLRSNGIENLMDESIVFLQAPKPFSAPAVPGGAVEEAAAGPLSTTENAFLSADPDPVPEAPATGTPAAGAADPAAGAVADAAGPDIDAVGTGDELSTAPLPLGDGLAPHDVYGARLSWWAKMGVRLRAYRDFFRAFKISEGDWRTLFGASGKNMTIDDVVRIRRTNRVLDALNDYEQTRLMIRAFVNERPALYARLNTETAEATSKYIHGMMEMDEYLKIRADKATELGMNDVVAAAERRMLQAVTKCRELGGLTVGGDEGGLISIGETNFARLKGKMAELADKIKAGRAKLPELKQAVKGTPGHSEMHAEAVAKLTAARRELLDNQVAHNYWRNELNKQALRLRDLYLEYVSNYEALDTFINLRGGYLNSEHVPAFNLPDTMVPNAPELARWSPVYERALYNSTNDIVVNESKLWFRTRIGHTRQFITKMNELTEKYVGRRFTETRFGKEFYRFNKTLAQTALTRVGTFLGVTIPSGMAYKYSDRIWHFIFGDSEATPEGPGAGSAGSGSGDPAGSASADPAGSAAPAGSGSAGSGATPSDGSTPSDDSATPAPSADPSAAGAAGAGSDSPFAHADEEVPPQPQLETPRPQDFSDDDTGPGHAPAPAHH
ncbi:MAG TPA: hypothetical protein VL588_08295 [Bdellovibrionota bacterium]|nr:hypothetical protein [Bdellovibrionota bacterium]